MYLLFTSRELLRRKAYHSCILPLSTYGVGNMSIIRKVTEQLGVMQRAIHSVIFGVTLRNQLPNVEIHNRTKFYASMLPILSGSGLYNHLTNHGYMDTQHNILETMTKEVERPQKRCSDDVKIVAGTPKTECRGRDA